MCFRFQEKLEVVTCGPVDENMEEPYGSPFVDVGGTTCREESLKEGQNADVVGTLKLITLELTFQTA